MIVLCCGDRNWTASKTLFDVLDALHGPTEAISLIVEGEARGADKMARNWAESRMVPFLAFPAHWKHTDRCVEDCKEVCGPPAGPIRNRRQYDETQPDLVVAFHDKIHESKGTLDMVTYAHKQGCAYKVYNSDGHLYEWTGERKQDPLFD